MKKKEPKENMTGKKASSVQHKSRGERAQEGREEHKQRTERGNNGRKK